MKIVYWLLLGALFGVWSCSNHSDTGAGDENPAVADSLGVESDPDNYFIKKYTGVINGNLAIEAILINWGDGYLSGRYWRQGKKDFFELSGELRNDGGYEISEYLNDKETGMFSGNLSNYDTLAGAWSNAEETKRFPFELYASPPSVEQDNWSGNWHLNGVWDGGRLLIGNVTKDAFDFALVVVRGSHNGAIDGQAAIQGDRAIFNKADFMDEPCVLKFTNRDSFIQVDQSSSNFACGFGARAYADGQYERRKRHIAPTLKVGSGDDDVFPTQALHDEFKELAGDAFYELFAFNMELVQSTTDKSGRTVVTGYVQGLFNSNEAIIIFDRQNHIWAATLDYDETDSENFVRYFTNDPDSKRKMPADIENWREGFKTLRVIL